MTRKVKIIRVLDSGRKVKIKKLKPRMRIITPKRDPTFVENLEQKARDVTTRIEEPAWNNLPGTHLRSEIALTLGHLSSVENLHARLRKNLLRLECYIDTELMQRAPRPPRFVDDRLPERDMLRARLLKIEAERRKLAIAEDQGRRELHDRLFTLMQRHTLLAGPTIQDANRRTRSET